MGTAKAFKETYTSTQAEACTSTDTNFINLLHGDCLQVMQDMQEQSVHLIVTDPPYFLDGLNTEWKKGGKNAKQATGSVGGLPVGMKFDPRQGQALQKFMQPVGQQMFRLLKPGGFAIIFSQPRLVHRLAVGIEDVGFEIRDLLAWNFTKKAQFKAFSMDHFIDRMKKTEKEKRLLKNKMKNRKTPQLRPQFEVMILAQKPKEGTFVENWMKHETGLIDSTVSLKGNVPHNLMTIEKPNKEKYNTHLTVKPVQLIEHLIKIFSTNNQIVLDPFIGSGTTAIASLNTNRSCIGIDIQKDYVALAKKRMKEALESL